MGKKGMFKGNEEGWMEMERERRALYTYRGWGGVLWVYVCGYLHDDSS
jgi:hypothetical protein